MILTKNEAGKIIDRITMEGGVIACGKQLTDDQATELVRTLEKLLKAL